SHGIVKVETIEELRVKVGELLEESDLVIAQEFLPTEFDWRIGVLGGHPLYACKYYMVNRHWQIYREDKPGELTAGRSETMPVEIAPRQVVRTAVKAANLIGRGFYGVDLKQRGRQIVVMEVNDNPSIDCDVEDAVLKGELYRRIMQYFLTTIERRKAGFDA
ncbi:MAG: ATP-grasp domain-containing protein, partial [Planctomycetia bacterium]